MVDLIFVVNEARKWHFDNLLLNPSHYSFLRYIYIYIYICNVHVL